MWELEHTEHKIREILEREDLNSIDKSLEVHKLILEMHKKHPPIIEHDLRRLYSDLFQEVRDFVKKKMYSAVIENIESGKKEGLIRKDLNSEIIAAIQITRYEAMRMSADMLENYTLEQILKEIIKYHLYGICSDKGRQYLKTLNL
jgi:Mg/Co/Ni transporter MgtE